jgi:hypothetical protein
MNKVFLLLVIIAAAIFTSCEKVIELNLDTTTSEIVIEGNIYNSEGPFKVQISKSVDFDESNTYPPITDALVIISDDHGTVDTLVDKLNDGIYYTQKTTGVPGYTYTLSITAEGKTYTATSTMNEPVEIDTVYAEDAGMDADMLTIKFMDPPNQDNYFNIVQYKNSEFVEEFNATNDRLYKNKEITYNIIWSGTEDKDQLNRGDHLVIWLEAVDKGAYDYFRTAGGGGQSASPSNPISNIDNDALGYFNACAVTKKEFSIK